MDERTTGTILRIRPLTETSLIVHWITPELGRFATVAKGARRAKSPFQGKLDLYYDSEFAFVRSRRSDLHNLREVRLISTRTNLRKDHVKLSAAAYAGTLIEQATEPETPLEEVYEVLVSFLNDLQSLPPSTQLIYAFEEKLLEAGGHGPRLDHPSLSPRACEAAENLLSLPYPDAAAIAISPQTLRELHIFLHHSIDQAYGRVPPLREKTIHAR